MNFEAGWRCYSPLFYTFIGIFHRGEILQGDSESYRFRTITEKEYNFKKQYS
jgi:hypothetical protein